MGAERVFIARCPEHGLHGARSKCFVCGAPVEQVPMVAEAELARLRDLLSEGVAAWERVDIMLRAAGFEAIDRDEAVARLIGQRDQARAARPCALVTDEMVERLADTFRQHGRPVGGGVARLALDAALNPKETP